MKIHILRLGHRLHRDERISTHCGLVARAFLANGIIYSGEKDSSLIKSMKKVSEKWGGDFEVKYEEDWKKVVKAWKGKKILLTIYGLRLPEIIGKLKKSDEDLLIIIGSEKVPAEIYDLVDYTIGITQQPHSEISSLAVFLHEFFKGKELNQEFQNAKVKVIPCNKGKKTIKS